VHPKVLIDDLLRSTKERAARGRADYAGPVCRLQRHSEGADKTEFYQHDQNWTNRMILGDSLQVMASLAEREGLRGKVQCIYFDPPYGIKFNSNFQWSTTSRDVKDGKADHITREPEQVKAFRDTWRDGIHSYLTYLRDRLTVARDLLTESGSIFVQIGDENVHRVRAVMDEVFRRGARRCAHGCRSSPAGSGSRWLRCRCSWRRRARRRRSPPGRISPLVGIGDRHRLAGVVDEQFLARGVRLAQAEREPPDPLPVEGAEAAVAVAGRVFGFVFLPEEVEGDALAPQFAVHDRPIGFGTTLVRRCRRRVQLRLQLRLAHSRRQWPGDAVELRAAEEIADGRR
jgi:hypothetical protein